MKVVPETRRAHQIRYLRVYCDLLICVCSMI